MGDRDIGWYVYCVVDARGLPRLNDLEAVDPAFGVEALPQGSLCAVTSPVHLAAFGEEPLKQHLEDLAWLERVARVHDAVLARLLDAGSVVPFRLFTIFTTGERVREMLDRERERLRAELDGLRGRFVAAVDELADEYRDLGLAFEVTGPWAPYNFVATEEAPG